MAANYVLVDALVNRMVNVQGAELAYAVTYDQNAESTAALDSRQELEEAERALVSELVRAPFETFASAYEIFEAEHVDEEGGRVRWLLSQVAANRKICAYCKERTLKCVKREKTGERWECYTPGCSGAVEFSFTE